VRYVRDISVSFDDLYGMSQRTGRKVNKPNETRAMRIASALRQGCRVWRESRRVVNRCAFACAIRVTRVSLVGRRLARKTIYSRRIYSSMGRCISDHPRVVRARARARACLSTSPRINGNKRDRSKNRSRFRRVLTAHLFRYISRYM